VVFIKLTSHCYYAASKKANAERFRRGTKDSKELAEVGDCDRVDGMAGGYHLREQTDPVFDAP
jgi:hypothetical protein